MEHTSKNMEDTVVESNVDYDTLIQEVSVENKFPKNHSCNISAKTVVSFFPYLQHLPETKLKIF